jgi:hypothetical protein
VHSTVLAAEPSAVSEAWSLSARASAVAGRLRVLVGELDRAAASGALGGAEAADVAAALAEVERLATAGCTVAAGRVAATGHYRVLAFPSPTRWLAATTGSGAGDASRVLATAAHLEDGELGATRAAFVAGRLTAGQANEIARTAAVAPGEEAQLLDLAGREKPARLRDECRRVRLASAPPDDPAARRRRGVGEMAFGTRDLGGGMGELTARMPTTWLVLVLAAVREQRDAIFERARREGRDDPAGASLVEALVTLLLVGGLGGGEAGGVGDAGQSEDDDVGDEVGDEVDGGAGARSGSGQGCVPSDGSDGSDGGGCGFDDPMYEELLASIRGAPPPRAAARRRLRRGRCSCGGRVAPRARILVRVDQSALLRGRVEGAETCEIAGVGPVAVETVRDLWPDAVVKLVLTRGVDVVNVTHLGRRATEAMAAAMAWQSPRCSNVACDHDQFLETDHRLGWSNVHRTRLDELDGLCHECHRLKSTEDWQLVRGRGRRRFVPPDHPDHPGDPPTAPRPG